MKRPPEKVKDFIEPQAFDDLPDFSVDPARALAAYRFTDATSDLLARWLDALANLPRGSGTARALAGLRGVGKSHTLTVFSAIAAFPSLRATVADAHVAASARRLQGRRYVAVRVERGTRPTLAEEIAAALSATFGGDETQWGTDPAAMLAIAASRAGDATLVLVVDTKFGRAARVGRDDGPVLGEMTSAAQHASIFIALALDDDIAGADGVNVAIAGAYQIDYLDPEHLYRVADLYIMQKRAQARAALHDIYMRLRASVPGFNWSEPRFAAVYPVHPLVADVAAAVRLYVPSFAFLPFAAAATARALTRPALSLVVLDEVFDRVEQDLRKAEDLQEAFAAYDQLATQVIPQLPVMQRLQAKLVLKGLLILSLDGRGATARELCAAMLFYDETGSQMAHQRAEQMLASFADAAPRNALPRSVDAGETRYRFNIGAAAGFDAALAEKVAALPISDAVITSLLSRSARIHFADWPFTDDPARGRTAELPIKWRGTERYGHLRWVDQSTLANLTASGTTEDEHLFDWQVAVLAPGVTFDNSPLAPGSAIWQPAPLTEQERDVLRRLAALRADATLLARFGETARAAESLHAAHAERIWARIYIDDGEFITHLGRASFTAAARGTRQLTEALGHALAPVMTARYREHPIFAEALGESEVTHLIGALFSGANMGEPGLQRMIQIFAAPLGLAAMRGSVCTFDIGDEILSRGWTKEVMMLAEAASGGVVPIEEVYSRLRREPYGLLREAQHLIIAALVAQRRLEIVTADGARIGRSALHGPINWGTITGLCRSTVILHSAEELTEWARRLTRQASLPAIADPAAREAVRAALIEWLKTWRAQDLARRADNLPDEVLTTRVAELAAAVKKSFGAAAEAIEAAVSENVSLEEALQRVADAFNDSPEIFARRAEQLGALADFTGELPEWLRARDYLAMAEPTAIPAIEEARRELLEMLDDIHSIFDASLRERFKALWREFKAAYVDHYVAAHDRAMSEASDRRALDRATSSDQWREFEMISLGISLVNRRYWEEAKRLLERAQRARCELPVRQLLAERPFCNCSFRLTHAISYESVSLELEDLVNRGMAAYRRTLALWSKHLARALEAVADESAGPEAEVARRLAAGFAEGVIPAHLTSTEIQLIEPALQATVLPPVRVQLPTISYGLMTREELRARLEQWLEELPEHPALLEISEINRNGG
jgi:hypothetical protein